MSCLFEEGFEPSEGTGNGPVPKMVLPFCISLDEGACILWLIKSSFFGTF